MICIGSNQSDPLQWVRKILTAEGVVINAHRPKHNFTVRDLTRILITIWTLDDLILSLSVIGCSIP
jgi:hypothetical protein